MSPARQWNRALTCVTFRKLGQGVRDAFTKLMTMRFVFTWTNEPSYIKMHKLLHRDRPRPSILLQRGAASCRCRLPCIIAHPGAPQASKLFWRLVAWHWALLLLACLLSCLLFFFFFLPWSDVAMRRTGYLCCLRHTHQHTHPSHVSSCS